MTAVTTILQIVDGADPTVVLFDLNDTDGEYVPTETGTAQYGYRPTNIRTNYAVGAQFAVGGPETEFSRFEPDSAPGGSTPFSRDPLVPWSWRESVEANSYTDLVAALGELARLLRLGGVVKWVPDDSDASTLRYVDFEPSPAPVLFAGEQFELQEALGSYKAIVDVTVWRQPHLRGEELDGADNLLSNATFLVDGDGDGTPDDWAWDSETDITAQAISAAEEAYQFTIATAAARNLQQVTEAASAAPGDAPPLSWYAKATGGAGAQAQAVIQWLDSGGTPVGSDQVGSLVVLTDEYQQVAVTPAVAPAGTDHMEISLRMDNTDATSYTVYFQRAQLGSAGGFRAGATTVTNDPEDGRRVPVLVLGDAPAPVRFKVRVTGTGSFDRILLADRWNLGRIGRRSLADLLNTRGVLQSEDGTPGTHSAVVTVAGASAGDVMRVTPSGFGENTMYARSTHALTTLLDSLRGDWDVWLRLKKSGADWTIRLDYALNAGGAGQFQLPVVPFLTGSSDFRMIRLGQVSIPEEGDLAGLFFEINVRKDTPPSGTPVLDLDCLQFVPRDAIGILESPAAGSSGDYFLTDPAAPEVRHLDTNSDLKTIGQMDSGPVPFLLEPGLHMITVLDGATDGYGGIADDIADTIQVTPIYAPRHWH